MTRAAKQKLARQSTAAYAASQPLFKALFTACNRIGEQRANLSVARDLVQNLHVKLVSQDSNSDIHKHERYIDHAIKAWKSATEIYADIFDQLAQATAADPSEGKEARDGHAEFAHMARTAADAKTTAKAFVLYESRAKVEPQATAIEDDQNDTSGASESEGESDTSSTSDIADAGSARPATTAAAEPSLVKTLGKRSLPQELPKKQDEQPSRKARRLNEALKTTQEHTQTQTNQHPQNEQHSSKDIKSDVKGKRTLSEEGAKEPPSPFASLGGSEKKAWRAEAARLRRERKRDKRLGQGIEKAAARAETRDHANGNVEDTSKPAHDRDYVSLYGGANQVKEGMTVPKVEYEDVSAEVDARLKVKQAKKEALKHEKKRKRESDNSVQAAPELDPEQNAEKPMKKKVKTVNGDAEVVAKKEKRKKHERDDEGAAEDDKSSRKKPKLSTGRSRVTAS